MLEFLDTMNAIFNGMVGLIWLVIVLAVITGLFTVIYYAIKFAIWNFQMWRDERDERG